MPDCKPAVEEDDQLLDRLFDRAARALAASGLTVQDFLDDLAAVRAEVVREAYSADFLRELERLHAAYTAERPAA